MSTETRGRKIEIYITLGMVVLAALLIMAPHTLEWSWSWAAVGQIGERLAYAILVALGVRWLNVWFVKIERMEPPSFAEFSKEIEKADTRIWISITWLPGHHLERNKIFQIVQERKIKDFKLILASFEKGSPIYTRIEGRDMTVEDAKASVRDSIGSGVDGLAHRRSIKFNSGHQSGWIAVIDSWVFWGPYPAKEDSRYDDFLIHRYDAKSKQGKFWRDEFDHMWESSHDYETERQHHSRLPILPSLPSSTDTTAT